MSGNMNMKVGAAKIARVNNNSKKSKKNNRKSKKRTMRTRRYRPRGIAGQTQTFRLKKREVWSSSSFTTGTQLTTVNISFDTTNGPNWFKTMSKQYEKYKLHWVNLYVRFGGSSMTKGLYVLTYNCNESKKADTTKSFEQLSCQKGSVIVPAAKQFGRLHINGSSLTGYSTTLPTEGSASATYAFNAIIAGIPVEAVDYVIEVEYDVTFYNPTIQTA